MIKSHIDWTVTTELRHVNFEFDDLETDGLVQKSPG